MLSRLFHVCGKFRRCRKSILFIYSFTIPHKRRASLSLAVYSMRSQFLIALLSLSLSPSVFRGGVVDAVNVNVSIPIAPPNTSQSLSPTLISFSIEQDRWPEWVGVQNRNEFTFNALDNYARLTGEPPKLRVGADSEDRTTWSPDVDVSTVIEVSILI